MTTQHFHARRALACLSGLLFSVGLIHGQGASDVRWLEEGKPIERQLSGGESHSYQLNVKAGQYARVIVDQRGIDVVVNLFGPDGRLVSILTLTCLSKCRFLKHLQKPFGDPREAGACSKHRSLRRPTRYRGRY
jgi:hypothetical protein